MNRWAPYIVVAPFAILAGVAFFIFSRVFDFFWVRWSRNAEINQLDRELQKELRGGKRFLRSRLRKDLQEIDDELASAVAREKENLRKKLEYLD